MVGSFYAWLTALAEILTSPRTIIGVHISLQSRIKNATVMLYATEKRCIPPLWSELPIMEDGDERNGETTVSRSCREATGPYSPLPMWGRLEG